MLGKTVSAGRHLIGISWLTRPAGVGKNASRVDTGVYSCPAGIKSTIRQVFLEICASASCTRVCVCYRTEMPTYVYKCADDGHVFDLIQGFNDKPGAECPTCGSVRRRARSRCLRSFTKDRGFIPPITVRDQVPKTGVLRIANPTRGRILNPDRAQAPSPNPSPSPNHPTLRLPASRQAPTAARADILTAVPPTLMVPAVTLINVDSCSHRPGLDTTCAP